jgi:1-acyl-sn-glycerol-3-phosphate acyltransferase
VILLFLRLILTLFLVPTYLLGSPKHPTDPSDIRHRRALLWSTRMCRVGMRIFGVRLKLHGRPDPAALLQVSNHLSYIDAVILSAARPALFVTSTEVRDDPLLGRITRAGGCEFVERRSVGGLAGECERLGRHLKHVPVLFFPEATSSDGSKLLRFKPAFFTTAIAARCPVQPLALRYPSVNGEPFTRANHHRICWYGDMAFGPHLIQLLTMRRVDAEIRYLDPIPWRDDWDRKSLAEEARKRISAALGYPTN